MKRGTPEHPKTKRLARSLGLERWGAVGVLESLWHFTSKFAPRGDVGRFSDEDIADGIGWTKDVSALVHALVDTNWLDACKANRLVVHDWKDHADEAVKKLLARNGWKFAVVAEDSDNVSTCLDAVATCSANNCLPLPLPLPEPLPLPGRKRVARAPRTPNVAPSRFVPPEFELTEARIGFALSLGMDLDRVHVEFAKIKDFEFKPPGHTDWDRAWRRWCRNSGEFEVHKGNGRAALDDYFSPEAEAARIAKEKHNREVIAAAEAEDAAERKRLARKAQSA